tara:strand:+ start:22114 stop:22320 length:207 start_codon:yes stop_codon:yes gene_type:complete
MMRKTLILALVALAGCSMSNEEIIAEHKTCQAAGMHGHDLVSGWNMGTKRVVCRPNTDGCRIPEQVEP